MRNVNSLYAEQYRKIRVKVSGVEKNVIAEKVKRFDPLGKFHVWKYAKRRVALVETVSNKVILQDCLYISKIKNGMSYYYNVDDEWGILNERGQIICEAGSLKSSRKK